ncbi:MAG TPA: multiheme c-type cytochrome [Kofleriaceae bacterium]|nr:multiheme c-type cytochrome [Kofleriaceae bacterium]
MKGGGSASHEPPKPSFTLFALAEVRGQIGPCGCTSDPLGDISRTTKLVDEARSKGPVLVVDAGSLLYAKNPVPAHLEAQEELKANLLASIYQDNLKVAAVGLGPADLAKGPEGVRFAREATNVDEPIKVKAPEVYTVGTAKVGVFGVIAKDAIHDLQVRDPVDTGKKAVADLRAGGAQVVIALVQASSKRDAVGLIRDIGGIDLSVAGLGAVAPEPDEVSLEPEKIGDGWLVIPGNRGQVLSRVDVTLRSAGPLVDAIGPGAASAKIKQLEKEQQRLQADLAKFKQDTSADPTFVKEKEKESERIGAKIKALVAQPLVMPPKGSYFTLEQIRINKKLACSVPVRDAIKSYDLAAGEANVKAAAGKLPVPPAKGKASYVGNEACSDCHQDQVDYWKTTVHSHAWKTLVDRGQQFDYECINCHVTGWEQPGGSTLSHNENLRDVGCETCHGPGSIHVAKGGEEKPVALVSKPADDLCATQCHTKEHSDTFEHTAYLRDILGKGHGEKARAALGDGPTGHDLRSAALDKAGRELGPGCVK